eukprot:5090121-Amphidinium_carterae.1
MAPWLQLGATSPTVLHSPVPTGCLVMATTAAVLADRVLQHCNRRQCLSDLPECMALLSNPGVGARGHSMPLAWLPGWVLYPGEGANPLEPSRIEELRICCSHDWARELRVLLWVCQRLGIVAQAPPLWCTEVHH